MADAGDHHSEATGAVPVTSLPSEVAQQPEENTSISNAGATTRSTGVQSRTEDSRVATIAPEEDEAIADLSDTASSTQSIRSSVLSYPIEYGRQYHAYKAGTYHRPNDEAELDRLDLFHAMLLTAHDDRLHLASLVPPPQRILDCGSGTGIWAIEIGEKFPNAEVIGVDISANTPDFVPPNVRFEIDDVEDQWTWGAPFDYIHSRYMTGGIKDWRKYVGQCFEHTKPGGTVEFQDMDFWIYSQDGSLLDSHALHRWDALTFEAAKKTGRLLNPGPQLEGWFKDAGFTDISVHRQPIPLGVWPKNKKLKKAGLYNWTQLWEGMQGMSLRLFVTWLGWSREELEVLMAEARADLKDSRIHAMYDVWTVWAKKPETFSSDASMVSGSEFSASS